MAGLVDFLQSLMGPAKNDANSYVSNNWPSDGRHAFHLTRPETFYTPEGMTPPPGGREPTLGETVDGAPHANQLIPFLSLLLKSYQGGR